MKRDYRDYLQDLLTAIDDSAEVTKDMAFDVFARDRKTINAVVRSLEVLGEAAKRIPDDLRPKHPLFRGSTWQKCATSSSMSISGSI